MDFCYVISPVQHIPHSARTNAQTLPASRFLLSLGKRAALKSAVTNFMKSIQVAQTENHSSVDLGTDLRLKSKKVTGFAVLLNDQILHLCIFTWSNGQERKNHTSRMGKYGQRRQNIVYYP
jgi:hypothetical protein